MGEVSAAKLFVSRVENDLAAKLREGLEWIGLDDFLKPDATVFVKPNFVLPEYLPGVVTSPEFLREVLSALKERCGRLIVGEADGPKCEVERAFENLGIYQICEEVGAELYNLSRLPSSWEAVDVGGKAMKMPVSSLAMESDVFITLPVLKTHMYTGVTIALKNQFGCIPDSLRLLYHHHLDQAIVAVNKLLRPQLAIVEAIHAMDGGNHIYGKPVRFDTLIVSNDLVAADSVGARMMGFSPEKVRHIRLAEAEGLGTSHRGQMQINGDLPEPIPLGIRTDWAQKASILVDKTYLTSKLVFDSPLTGLIYRLIRRKRVRRTNPRLGG